MLNRITSEYNYEFRIILMRHNKYTSKYSRKRTFTNFKFLGNELQNIYTFYWFSNYILFSLSVVNSFFFWTRVFYFTTQFSEGLSWSVVYSNVAYNLLLEIVIGTGKNHIKIGSVAFEFTVNKQNKFCFFIYYYGMDYNRRKLLWGPVIIIIFFLQIAQLQLNQNNMKLKMLYDIRKLTKTVRSLIIFQTNVFKKIYKIYFWIKLCSKISDNTK